jgi:hypothetical protein
MNFGTKREKIRLALVVAGLILSAVFPGPPGCMSAAIVATVVINKANYKSWTLTCLDADTTLNLAHGFVTNAGVAVAPDQAFIQNSFSFASAALPNWGIVITSTQIQITKQNAGGSGGTTPGTTQVGKLYAWRPHSIAE